MQITEHHTSYLHCPHTIVTICHISYQNVTMCVHIAPKALSLDFLSWLLYLTSFAATTFYWRSIVTLSLICSAVS